MLFITNYVIVGLADTFFCSLGFFKLNKTMTNVFMKTYLHRYSNDIKTCILFI